MCKWPECDFRGFTRKDNLLRHMKNFYSKAVTTDAEDTCNVASLQDAYNEAIQNRKELEKSLTILKLVQDGNVTSLELLLHEGGNFMETTDTGKTALHVAAFNGHLKIVKLLLNTNIEHNAKDSDGRSALHGAARGGHSQIFRELIAAGLNLFDRNNNDEDPLCEACRNGHRDIVQEILEMQTQLRSRNDSPSTSTPSIIQSTLHKYHGWVKTVGRQKYIKMAIENGHRAITEVFLFQHSDSNQEYLAYALQKAASMGEYQLVVSILQQKDQLSLRVCSRALMLAAIHRHIPIMDTLFEEAIRPKIGADMKELQILFLQVIAGGNDDIVRFLIGKGVNVNYQSGRHRITPLCTASRRGKLTIVTTLLEAGAHVDLLSFKGTALQEAVKKGNRLTIDLLIERGADVNAPGSYPSGTALQEAVEKGDKLTIELLIERGADVNAPGSYYSWKALREAVKKGDEETVHLLIEKGAEVNAPADNRSSTALQEAAKIGNKAIFDLLIENGAEVNALASHCGSGTALQEAIRGGNEWIITQLIQLGADVNAPDAPGATCAPNPGVAIQEAVRSGDQVIVDILLLAGADVKVPANSNCGTPLQEAVRNSDEYMVKQLIDLGVDVNAPDVNSSKNYVESNRNPEIAIREAVKMGNQTIVNMLIRAGAIDPKAG
ncbi:hypothetical protein BHYA_0048g00410 [Botrytis hyacinthi]|uniref:Uncharacterized protein n=1 Tax=Botrytis hyacinthi TaxID=278943 RepID=A0A4Z1GSA8_9HELO|nr:hypothetical protein BHYA_0048g00410 [Botrytis hyacinthi]